MVEDYGPPGPGFLVDLNVEDADRVMLRRVEALEDRNRSTNRHRQSNDNRRRNKSALPSHGHPPRSMRSPELGVSAARSRKICGGIDRLKPVSTEGICHA